MWYKLCLIPVLLAGCGDDSRLPALDASAEVDMSSSADMSVTPLDMTLPRCVSPKPGTYSEQVVYNYVPVGTGGSPQLTSSFWNVAVHPDGELVRPQQPVTDASRFHCSFLSSDVDANTCLAQCCPGQPMSPVVYVSEGGWLLWMTGTCTFSVQSGSQFAATVLDVQGTFNR